MRGKDLKTQIHLTEDKDNTYNIKGKGKRTTGTFEDPCHTVGLIRVVR